MTEEDAQLMAFLLGYFDHGLISAKETLGLQNFYDIHCELQDIEPFTGNISA